jgi:hypothetical protein
MRPKGGQTPGHIVMTPYLCINYLFWRFPLTFDQSQTTVPMVLQSPFFIVCLNQGHFFPGVYIFS